MSNTTFTTGTLIASSWLNDVNTATYSTVPNLVTNAASLSANNTFTGNNTFSNPLTVAPATAAGHALQASQTIGSNVIVNGGCEVSQVNGTTGLTLAAATAAYPLDNLYAFSTQASKVSIAQVSNKLNSLGAVNAALATSLSAATIAASDICHMRFPIEGLNFARFQYGSANAKTASLQFKINTTGLTYPFTGSGVISNYANTRAYPFTYTLAAAGDQLVTVPNIPGDTGGTWVGATNQGAAYIAFDLGGGATYRAAAGSWAGANTYAATGASTLIATNAATLSITDVQFEVGSFCTTYERKLYDQVLRECRRYLPSWSGASCGYAGTTSTMYVVVPFGDVTARTTPTGISTANGVAITAFNLTTQAASAAAQSAVVLSSSNSGPNSAFVLFTVAGTPFTQNTIAGVPGVLYMSGNTLFFTGAQL